MKKKIVKNLLYFKFNICRSVLNPLFKFKEIVVLMYHSINNNKWSLSVDPEVFAKQMEYLAKNKFKVVPLSEIIDYLENKKELLSKTVAITFDDGYLDNFQNAYPILKKHHFPATIFNATKDDRSTGCASPYQLFNWQQAKEMVNSGLITIEAHSDTHPSLKAISAENLKVEIQNSVKKIYSNLNYKSQIFAYPGGRYNKQVINRLKAEGFRAGFTTNEGLIKKGDDLFCLKRISVHRSVSFFVFRIRLTKTIDWYATLLRWLRIRGMIN